MSHLPALPHRRAILAETRGTAAVEFAIIASVLVFIFIATFQVLLLLRTSEKLNTLAGNLAGMVAVQAPAGTLAPATLADICLGAVDGLSPLPPQGLVIDIASLTVKNPGSTADYWETDYTYNRATGACSASTTQNIGPNSVCALATGMFPHPGAVAGDNAIIIRATLTYPGLAGLWLPSAPTLTQTTFTRWSHAAASTELKLSGTNPAPITCTT